MLCLKQRLLSVVRAAASPAAASLHRLSLSTTSAAGSAAPFVAEDYLVASCGLTPAQARKASKYLSHLRSPIKPDAVLAFLEGIGLAKAGVAASVVSYPQLISCNVDKTLTPCIAQLREIGLSPPQISRLIAVAPDVCFSPVKISRLKFYLSFLGSYDRVYSALKRNNYLLRRNVETLVRPNIAFLQNCGISEYDIGKYFLLNGSKLLSTQRVEEIAARAEELGVPRNSVMFKYALLAVSSLNPVRLNAKLDFLKKALGCSEPELHILLRKLPTILKKSESKISRTVEFLKLEVGLEPSYIVSRPAMFCYSIERRMMPRHHFINLLMAKGLVKKEIDFYSIVALSDKNFVEKFLVHYKESVPLLIDAYAAACTGQVPPKLQL